MMNYDSFLTVGIWGTVSKGQVTPLRKICNSSFEALACLTDFYNLHSSSNEDRHGRKTTSSH
ncbi:conserved hypothetical protein [Ricinus communis]|uniref:Uncharacterized protein n=1 Tax=Ricinus communis TaxID=3988 RepID=B9RL49_RICCO|nr:conserved hypothetical protein [Ricinus communis]